MPEPCLERRSWRVVTFPKDPLTVSVGISRFPTVQESPSLSSYLHNTLLTAFFSFLTKRTPDLSGSSSLMKGDHTRWWRLFSDFGKSLVKEQGRRGCSYECNGWPRTKDLKGCRVGSNIRNFFSHAKISCSSSDKRTEWVVWMHHPLR